MKNYESPVIYDNEELAEGVYATGSGGGVTPICWIFTLTHKDDNSTTTNPGWNKSAYALEGKHLQVEHISLGTTVQFSITNDTVKYIEIEGVANVYPGMTGTTSEIVTDGNGNPIGPRFAITLNSTGDELTVVRNCHANAYAGAEFTDDFVINLLIYCTNGLAEMKMIGTPWCNISENVQGRGGDGS